MRRLIGFLSASLIACACMATPRQNYLEVAVGTNNNGSATANLNGYVEAVYVSSTGAGSTGTVAVSYAPLQGATAVNIATNAVTTEDVWRPGVDMTGVDGAALTGDPPVRYALAGELVTFAITASDTGVTWTCVILINDN